MIVFEKPKALTDAPLHYCPGCTHGIIHRLVAEAIDALNVGDVTVGVAPVGCAVFAYNYFSCDMIEAAHGRAPPGPARRTGRFRGETGSYDKISVLIPSETRNQLEFLYPTGYIV